MELEAPKKKRELTEAQRLAFLKARETRARNLEARRKQKEDQKTVKREKRKQVYKKERPKLKP